MSGEVLGFIRVTRTTHMGFDKVYENLYLTPDRMVIAQTSVIRKEVQLLEIITALVAVIGGYFVGTTVLYPLGATIRFEQLQRFGVGLLVAGIFLLIPAGITMAILGATVKKKEKEYSESPLENILKAHTRNYAVPNSEVTEVELKKSAKRTELNIKTSKNYGETKWSIREASKDANEKYENMLRPIFKDRLIVMK